MEKLGSQNILFISPTLKNFVSWALFCVYYRCLLWVLCLYLNYQTVLVAAFPNNLHRVNHYLFKGKQTFQKGSLWHNKFRKTFLTLELKKNRSGGKKENITLNNSTFLDFRVLIAGGGTGMNTLYIAEQLNHTNVSYPLIAILTFKYGNISWPF